MYSYIIWKMNISDGATMLSIVTSCMLYFKLVQFCNYLPFSLQSHGDWTLKGQADSKLPFVDLKGFTQPSTFQNLWELHTYM